MIRQLLRLIFALGKLLMFPIRPILDLFQRLYQALENKYVSLLKWALRNRAAVLTTASLLFLLTLLMIPGLGVELIPQLSQGEFNVEFKLPPGTPLERTDALLKYVHQETAELKNISMSFAVAGSGNRLDANPEQAGENWGEINFKMTPGVTRSQEESVMGFLRERLTDIPGTTYKFSRPALFSFKTPVEIEVVGYDLDRLREVSRVIVSKLESYRRYADIKSTVETGHPEIRIIFDRERAAALGIPVYLAAERVVSKVRGTVASKYSWHDRKIDIMVRCREQDRTSVADIRNLIINPESTYPVTLDEIATISEDIGPGEINRVGQERVAIISANLNFGDLGSAAEELQTILPAIPKPHEIDIRLAGQNEEMAVSFSSLRFALLLAIFLVYLVLASQFESLLHPFVIIFTIPLALIGAVAGLWITGSTISVVVFIGLILLAGIVVNNAIVLIDLINKLRVRGLSKFEAIVEGGHARLRPIMMTTLTTTLGLLPLALGFGEGAELRSPMAITVIGGLLVSTLLTLVVIPVVYDLLDRKKFAPQPEKGLAA
jgi:HAE1 family hydrophobic/amphiphilic exporter-1